MAAIAGRYARALFEASRDAGTGTVTRNGELLDSFSRSLSGNPDLRAFLEAGIADRTERKRFLGELFTGPEDAVFLRFLGELVEKNRMDQVGSIALAYRRLELEAANVREAVIESAFPLDNETLGTIASVFKQKTGASELRTVVRIDPNLIGGIRVVIGSSVYDGTVRSELDRLHGFLTE